MGKNFDQKISGLSKKRQDKINARAKELIAEEMSMRDLRKALNLTQNKVAKVLGISQDNVSRLECRTDVLLSTLQSFVKSLGGELSLIAEFPNRPPVSLKGFSAMKDKKNDSKNVVRRQRR
ncbi:MAG: helix-turn-helix transcriptional regulator [Thermodesulfobacteriota bacterium]